MKKWLWFTLCAVLVSLIGLGIVQSRTMAGGTVQGTASEATDASDNGKDSGMTSKTGSEGKPLPAVSVEIVAAQPLVRIATLTGTVTPTRTARLASPGEGPVEACMVEDCMVREGDSVKKGQVLLQISRNKAAQAQVSAAGQALREQEAELRRITQLVRGGAIPGAQLDAARSKHENARAQLAKAMESAEDYLISAPWAGVVSKVHVAEGDYVAPRSPLIELFDPTGMVVRFAVPESQSTEVSDGMPVEVALDAHPGKTFRGTISRVYPQLDDRTHTRTVEATLNDPVALIPNMFARIQVILDQIPEAVTIPTYSLAPAPNGEQWAFIVEDGKALRRKLDIGMEVDGRLHVLAGLPAGERIIVAGQEKLKDGAMVKVVESMAAQATTTDAGNARP